MRRLTSVICYFQSEAPISDIFHDISKMPSIHDSISALTVNYRSPYNLIMTRDSKEDKLRSRVRDISHFYHEKGRMPSFSEIGEIVGFNSKNAVFKLVNKLEQLKFIDRDEKGRLVPGSIASTVRILGLPVMRNLFDSIQLFDPLVFLRGLIFKMRC